MKFFLPLTLLLLAPVALLQADDNAKPAEASLPPGVSRVQMKIDGLDRDALVYAPESATSTSAPLVFVFHGHGGTSLQMVRRFDLSHEWPEAISVYMQGLHTPGALTDPEGKKSGWQHGVGDQSDRDLKFFDAMLAKLKQDYKVDEKRIYATGHSNGGGFTYLLWETRPDLFAAFAPAASAAKSAPSLKPKPALHIAGQKDPLVKFEWQRLTMDALKKVNGCESEGKPWDKDCVIYPSKSGTPLVEFIHPGGHELPAAAPTEVAKFFREHPATEK